MVIGRMLGQWPLMRLGLVRTKNQDNSYVRKKVFKNYLIKIPEMEPLWLWDF